MSQTSRPPSDARTGTTLRRHVLQVLAGQPPGPLLRAARPHFRRALGEAPRDEVDTLASDFVLACMGPGGKAFAQPLLERTDAELPGALAALAVELQRRRAAAAPPPTPGPFPLVGARGLSLDERLGAYCSAELVVEHLRDELSPMQFAWVGLAWRGLDERAAAAALGLDLQQAAVLAVEAADALERARFELRLG
jgi:hypothetical protein